VELGYCKTHGVVIADEDGFLGTFYCSMCSNFVSPVTSTQIEEELEALVRSKQTLLRLEQKLQATKPYLENLINVCS